MIKIAVDGYCLNNPGKGGYQGFVLSKDKGKERLFEKHLQGVTTNNIVEFLAIVHAIAEMNKQGIEDFVIYTDSKTAIAWLWKKKVNTNLYLNLKTADSWTLINRAVDYLNTKARFNPENIVFWDKRKHGENPADFGHK